MREGNAKAAGIDIDETASKKTLQGDAEIPTKQSKRKPKHEGSAELLKDRKDNETIENKQVTISKARLITARYSSISTPETKGKVVVQHAIEQRYLTI
jgi:hypothetical protein